MSESRPSANLLLCNALIHYKIDSKGVKEPSGDLPMNGFFEAHTKVMSLDEVTDFVSVGLYQVASCLGPLFYNTLKPRHTF